MTRTCEWPGCRATSSQPFTDGWCAYTNDTDMLPGLADEGWLCLVHKLALDALDADEQPPTGSEH